MANSYTLLADLKTGRCSNTAEVRLLRFWEARNTKKGGELMSLDMLFLDEQVISTNPIFAYYRSVLIFRIHYLQLIFYHTKQSTLIQRTMSATRRHTYRPYLSEGSIYSLSGFDVTRSNSNFRLSDASVSIQFSDGTMFVQVTDSDKVIPTEMFWFRSYDQILALANTNRQLPGLLLTFSISNCLTSLYRIFDVTVFLNVQDMLGELSAIRSFVQSQWV